MPYAKNTISVINAKLKSVDTRYIQDGQQITNVRCYEYQGKNKRTQEPEGISWNLELWGKTAEFFINKQPTENVDRISFNGSVIDKSFKGDDGKINYRQAVRVNNIEIHKAEVERESF